MIEIVCPSCEAHYQLPDGSIGPDGRNVSCSSCAHKWRAFAEGREPPGTAAEPEPAPAPAPPPVPAPASPIEAATEPAPSPAETIPAETNPAPPPTPDPSYRPNPDHVAQPAAAQAQADDDARAIAATLASVEAEDRASAAAAPAPAGADREEQMEAIRKMLSDLKEGAEAAAAAEVVTAPKKSTETVAAPVRRKRGSDADEEADTLKSRIDELTNTGKTARGEAAETGYDAQKLRKLHERRAKKLQKARDRRKKSSAFISGFTFVAVIALTMVGLYVMKPQITAASPQMAPALDEYVVTVDRYRVELNETTSVWRDWVAERIAKLRGEEPANAPGGGASGTAGTDQTQ